MDLANNAAKTAEEAVQLLTAKPCPIGRHDGHPRFAARRRSRCTSRAATRSSLTACFGMEASYAGTSFLTPDKRGSFRYGSDTVTIVADATVPGGARDVRL